jgi:hypothetical protein
MDGKMNIKSQLLKYQQEMDDLEKKAERIKGNLDSEYNKLRQEIKAEASIANEKLEKLAEKLLSDLTISLEEQETRLTELMEEIEEKYEEIQAEE